MIPFIRPEMPPLWSYLWNLIKVHRSGVFSNNGQMVRQLEQKLAKFVNAENAVCVANATVGLEVAIKAVLGKGDNTQWIAVPAFTFPATANAIINAGYIPYYLDIHLNRKSPELNYLADFSDIKDHFDQGFEDLYEDVVAFVPVSAFGKAIPGSYIKQARELFGKVIVDAAPGIITNKSLTRLGADAVVYSMHATKSIPCGEGGFICFADKQDEETARLLINFGLKDGVAEISPDFGGTNGKMNELEACVGLASLERAEHVARRKEGLFLDIIEGSIIGLAETDDRDHLLVVNTRGKSEDFEKNMKERGVQCKRYYSPLSNRQLTPKSWKAFYNICCVPFYSTLTKKEIRYINQSIKECVDINMRSKK